MLPTTTDAHNKWTKRFGVRSRDFFKQQQIQLGEAVPGIVKHGFQTRRQLPADLHQMQVLAGVKVEVVRE